MLKRFAISAILVNAFCVANAANGDGFFLGFDIGGGLGGLSNNNFKVTTNIDPDLPPTDTMQINAGFGLNVRIGGQGYFNERNGMRGYLSIGGVFGAPSYAFGDLKATGITAVADFNVDYLHDFMTSEVLRIGFYMGFSSGYLMTFYPGGSALILADRNIPHFRGVTAGLNFGFRAVISNHNQFEFATKSVVTNSVATENIFGFQLFIGANYSYIF